VRTSKGENSVIRSTELRKSTLALLLGGTALTLLAQPAWAQAEAPATITTGSLEATAEANVDAQEITVTGSRIRRTETTTSAPVTVIDVQVLNDRGYVQAGEALNQITSIDPSFAQSANDGSSSGNGRQYPALFGLGAARTLTLVNGRRFVASGSGLGAPTVDTNMIPTGLLKRVEVVEAGGAAVYGSDAISGVINYILDDSFDGLKLDAQTGISDRGDYPNYSLRATAGKSFADGRGNFAVNVDWSQTDPLTNASRPRTNLSRVTVTNAADTGPADGIPALREVTDAHFWEYNYNGVLFFPPNPTLLAAGLVKLGGVPLQFDASGMPVAYNPGTILGVPFAAGGEGIRYNELGGLYTGIERLNVNAIGHFDITDGITFSTELLYGRTKARDLGSFQSRTVLGSAAANTGPIQFNRFNPYLSTAAIATLSAAQPSFGGGAPMFLSKAFRDLVPSNESITETEVYRGVAALDGEFNVGARQFYWSTSFSYGRTEASSRSWGVSNARFNNAINAVRNTAGTIVCAINNDAIATNDDTACAPINPFGDGNVSAAARNYVGVLVGSDYVNEQYDALATLGGSLFTLPGGDLRFSLAYEHRAEEVAFTPTQASLLGQTGSGIPVVARRGKYDTDEVSGELLIPIVGGDFTLPLVKSLELSAAYRIVDNSIAGRENVWNAGLRWEVTEGVTLRGSRSRNFRAPSLNELFAPATNALGSIGFDPCDADRINAGPNPAARRANCTALFAANPGWGPLASFQDPAENFSVATITSGGNANLRNEVSDTLTFGVVFQPRFIPGLTFTADRIQIDLQDGLSTFNTQNFLETCYDTTPQPTDVCSRFTRLAVASGTNPAGTIITGTTTTFNAGRISYRGEKYNLNYAFGLDTVFGGGDLGRLDLGVEATHTSLLETSVTGFDVTRSEGTETQPDWVVRFDASYVTGPLRLTYQLSYLPGVLRTLSTTIENNPNPYLEANYTHSVSMSYDLGAYAFRFGVTNLTDEEPSYPSVGYGDILGRRYFAGVRVKL
jgi:outer membrane receptor protein involved in Fe transport